MLDTLAAVVSLAGILALSGLVYWDARRVGVGSPILWTGVVFWLSALGLGLILFVPTVPVAGALVLVVAGPVLYLFERDDTKHGDEPADPHVLPDAGVDTDGDADENTDDNSNAGDERNGETRR